MVERKVSIQKPCKIKYHVESSDPIYGSLNGLLEDESHEGCIWFDPDQPFAEISFMIPLDPRGEEIPIDRIQLTLIPMAEHDIANLHKETEDSLSYLSSSDITSLESENITRRPSSTGSYNGSSKVQPLHADNLSIASRSSSKMSDSEKSYPYLLGEIKVVDITIINDVQWACVNFTTPNIQINQDDKMLRIPVARTDRLNNKVRVHWSIPEMSASDDVYCSMKGILTIPPDAVEAVIPIEMFPRPLDSDISKFRIVLGPGISDEACLGGETECEVEIINNIGRYFFRVFE